MIDECKEFPIVFISYCWEDDSHQEWVRSLADLLLDNGIDVILDIYDIALGDRIPQFMEASIKQADKVLIICTEQYKEKADKRSGGVGYEEHIISYELVSGNDRKYIPILRKGSEKSSVPDCLLGKKYYDLRKNNDLRLEDISELIYCGIFEQTMKPPMGKRPKDIKNYSRIDDDDIRILEIVADEVTAPLNDGTPGSALYRIPFRLSRIPDEIWMNIFIDEWNHPQSFTMMHRPGIAYVEGNRIILDGTTLEEVQKYHKETLIACVNNANIRKKQYTQKLVSTQENARIAEEDRKRKVEEMASKIVF